VTGCAGPAVESALPDMLARALGCGAGGTGRRHHEQTEPTIEERAAAGSGRWSRLPQIFGRVRPRGPSRNRGGSRMPRERRSRASRSVHAGSRPVQILTTSSALAGRLTIKHKEPGMAPPDRRTPENMGRTAAPFRAVRRWRDLARWRSDVASRRHLPAAYDQTRRRCHPTEARRTAGRCSPLRGHRTHTPSSDDTSRAR
jgi:hypothetical protein